MIFVWEKFHTVNLFSCNFRIVIKNSISILSISSEKVKFPPNFRLMQKNYRQCDNNLIILKWAPLGKLLLLMPSIDADAGAARSQMCVSVGYRCSNIMRIIIINSRLIDDWPYSRRRFIAVESWQRKWHAHIQRASKKMNCKLDVWEIYYATSHGAVHPHCL